MRAVAINGSPRKGGNTEILLKQVLAPLAAAGWDTEFVQIGGASIRGCQACYSCFKKQNAKCSQKDDAFNPCFEKMAAADAGGKHYTGAGVISKQAFKYGYYESRFKVPPGAGWHTSFWMMKHNGQGGTGPTASAQELDVCENDSVNLKNYGVNVHKWNPQPHVAMGHKAVKTPDLASEFHVYGCEFTPEKVKYYFDGRLVQTVDVSKFEPSEQNIWLTTIASNLGGTKAVDDTKLPAEAEYDYVRFYERK